MKKYIDHSCDFGTPGGKEKVSESLLIYQAISSRNNAKESSKAGVRHSSERPAHPIRFLQCVRGTSVRCRIVFSGKWVAEVRRPLVRDACIRVVWHDGIRLRNGIRDQ
ncbi:MAG: hypothetical protein DMG78_27140 [Acidobacteria bacterium]|nr:MAG: hypothetical protein DMG78_27140 [Acidobacteriota bacterium]